MNSLKNLATVRAEIIAELIQERARPVIYETFLMELMPVRLIPVICPARRTKPENDWKRYLFPDKAHPAIKSAIYQKLIPENIFPDPL